MIDNLLGGNDDGETPAEPGDEEMDGLFDDPNDGGLDGGDGLDGDDDLLDGGGMDDDLMGDDDVSFGDSSGGGDATSDEMNNRIEELENELDSLSSSVNTVKSENEQISESLDEVDENIRKLLEVYEMVTRGVNPFVNDAELGDGFGGGGGSSLGLFGDGAEEEPDDEGTDIDESVANADAEEFFDDDPDDGSDVESDESELDVGPDDSELDDEFDGDGEFDAEFDDVEGAIDDSGGGKSFEELKSEYESGEADRDEGDDEESGAEAVAEDDGSDADGDDEPNGSRSDGLEKPYLESLPSGFVAEMAVMDWLEYLVDEAGIDGAARTIAYYEAVEWVSTDAAAGLRTFLSGFGAGVELEADPEPRSPLSVAHHDESLRFIGRITSPTLGVSAFGRTEASAPGSRQNARRRSIGTTPATTQSVGPSSQKSVHDGGLRRMESDGGRHTHVDEHAADRTAEAESAGDRCAATDSAADESGFIWVGDR